MSKLFFLLVLTLVAAVREDKDDALSQTNTASSPTEQLPDSSQTTSLPLMQEMQQPPSTSSGFEQELYLLSVYDMVLLDKDPEIKLQLSRIDENQQITCAKVTFSIESADSDCGCVYHIAKRDIKHCNNDGIDVKPTVQKLTEKDPNSDKICDVSCGPEDKEGSMFSFGYKACKIDAHLKKKPKLLPPPKQENSDFFEVYKFCHSKKENKVIYTEHIIHDSTYLAAASLKIQREQDEKYNMMFNGFEYFDSMYATIAGEYGKLKFIYLSKLGAFPRYTPKVRKAMNSMVQAQQLVPVDDMAFTLTRRPTYHYLNIAPMKYEHITLWNYMSHLIREDARKNCRNFSINTGAYIVNPRKEKRPITMVIENSDLEKVNIEEADVWIKMIRYEEQGSTSKEKKQIKSFAIVMNTGLDEMGFKKFNDEQCKVNLCEKAFATYKTFTATHDLVRCCPAKKIAETFFNKEVVTESSFTIETFTEPKEMSLDEKQYMKKLFFPVLM